MNNLPHGSCARIVAGENQTTVECENCGQTLTFKTEQEACEHVTNCWLESGGAGRPLSIISVEEEAPAENHAPEQKPERVAVPSEPHPRCGRCGREVPGGTGTPSLCIDCLNRIEHRESEHVGGNFDIEWAEGWDPQMYVDEDGDLVSANDKYPFWQKGAKSGEHVPDTVVECVDNSGMEDQFDVGVEYILDSKDGDFFTVYDKLGIRRECFRDRFREVTAA